MPSRQRVLLVGALSAFRSNDLEGLHNGLTLLRENLRAIVEIGGLKEPPFCCL